MDNATHIIGIDIAKLKFDLALIINGKIKVKAFKNTLDGFQELSHWLNSNASNKFTPAWKPQAFTGKPSPPT